MGILIGIGGSFILAALVSYFLVFNSDNDDSDSDVDYRG
jgi:glucose-6-phosphate isomerase